MITDYGNTAESNFNYVTKLETVYIFANFQCKSFELPLVYTFCCQAHLQGICMRTSNFVQTITYTFADGLQNNDTIVLHLMSLGECNTILGAYTLYRHLG